MGLVFWGYPANTNFIIFGLTTPGHRLTIYHNRGSTLTITPLMQFLILRQYKYLLGYGYGV